MTSGRPIVPQEGVRREPRPARGYALLAWALTVLFLLRVAGQAVQHWLPQPYLPAFDEFQGSDLPYGALLLSQVAILSLMAYFARRIQAGLLVASPRAGRVLAWLGGIYMAAALGRIAAGLLLAGASPWFTAWIPAAFHVVLAAYVLTFAVYHCVESRARREKGGP